MALLSFFWRLFSGETRPVAPEFMFFGLGNTGDRYAKTRHNIGFRVVDELASRFENKSAGTFGQAVYVSGTLFNSKNALAVKPNTFMNRSGLAVASYLNKAGGTLQNTLVIVDDYHLPLGTMRARRSGSDGGHNGLASIVASCGEGFPRLRIGIGPLPPGTPSIGFVLGDFSESEEAVLEQVVPRAADACLCFAQSGIAEVMNRYNR